MIARLLALCAVLTVANVGIRQLHASASLPQRSITAFPGRVDGWTAGPDVKFDPDVERLLKADSYINRVYVKDSDSVSLYVGYHRSQTQGVAIHSPLNCLPGAGWQPTARRMIAVDGRGSVNLVTVTKGDERQAVVYWYQTAGRVVASEYKSRAFLVLDSLTSGRSDAALVRIMAPLTGATREANGQIELTAESFAASVMPLVGAELFPQ